MIQNNCNKKLLKGVSLFSSAGIAETYLRDIGINIIVANELKKDRADLYSKLYPETKMIVGDITNKKTFSDIVTASGDNVDYLIATPPCQGMSVAGKNRTFSKMLDDQRNHLFFKIIDFINIKKPSFVLLENVPNFLKIKLPFQGKLINIPEILEFLYGDSYKIVFKILDTSDYGVPQRRLRAVIKMYKNNLRWDWPKKRDQKITLFDAIGHLPSLESGQKSNIPWHFSRKHLDNHVTWMKHTPTGKSAFENKTHYPKKKNGDKIKSYMTTYKRMSWNEPAPTITIRNDAISSQSNVHPGNKLKDSTYSDARVLTPLELMILSSLPEKWNIPDNTPEILIRKCIGECVPPLLIKNVTSHIMDNYDS